MKTFAEFKAEILKRAKAASACTEQRQRAYKSEDWPELFKVITDNWSYACNNNIIDPALIEEVKDEAAKSDVYINVTVTSGFLLASDSAIVEASDSAIVEAYGSATVMASDSATVMASDSATVEAYGSATVMASGSATVRASGSATVRAYGSATVRAYDSATVEASGSAYINVQSTMDCKISDHAIMRHRDTNEIVIVKGKFTVKEIEP